MRSIIRFFDVRNRCFLLGQNWLALFSPSNLSFVLHKLFFVIACLLSLSMGLSFHPLQGESLLPAQTTNFQGVEDFQQLAMGRLDGQHGWVASDDNHSTFNVNVISDPENSNNQVIEVKGTDGSYAYKAVSAINNLATGTLFFRMRHRGDIDGFGGLSDHPQPVQFQDYQVQFGDQHPSDQFVVRSGSDFLPLNTTFDPETWYCVWLIADNSFDQFQVYIQNAHLAQTQLTDGNQSHFQFRTPNQNSALTTFFTRMGQDNNGSLYFDDIYLDPVANNLADPSNLCSGTTPPPSANFNVSPSSGDAPLTVTFQIVNTANLTNCAWNYGDGTTGTSCDASHSHLYTSAGSYPVTLNVSGPGGSDSQTRTVTVTSSPTVQLSASTYRVNEADGAIVVQVTLNRSSTQQVTVNYATTNGTALAGSDYTANQGILTFAPGAVNASFTVAIQDDAIDETDETVNLTLSNPSNAVFGVPSTASLTILDNDEPVGPTATFTPTPLPTATPTSTPTPTTFAPTPTATHTVIVSPTDPRSTAIFVAYIPLVERQPTPTPTPTPIPIPRWQRIGQAGLVASSLALHKGQLFMGERKRGATPGGLYRLSLENCLVSNTFERINITNSSSVSSSVLGIVFQDNLGVAASYDTNSIFYSTDDGKQWISSSQVISHPRTVAIAGGGVFYSGAENAGIFRNQNSIDTWQNVATTPSQINIIKLDTHTLWIGSQNGVWKFTPGSEPERVQGLNDSENKQVWDLAFRASNEIYIATFHGIYRGDGRTDWQIFALASMPLYSLELKKDELTGDILYAGLQKGEVWKKNLNGGDWELLGGNFQESVRDLLYDDQYCKGLLAATEDGVWLYR